ncbi:unnamed protein product [Polarella glacialis]|uniref:Uncharacterized protein n=1 Tax=Polarella glacialis TaxID=89957 RepID=A0A813JJ08_POLGL|nr:unnamed protein product [Polarella glacialis]
MGRTLRQSFICPGPHFRLATFQAAMATLAVLSFSDLAAGAEVANSALGGGTGGAAAAAAAAVAVAEEAQAALADCQRDLQQCNSGAGAGAGTAAGRRLKSSLQAPGYEGAAEWPEGYGKLLTFPFGLADMRSLKELARSLWSPDGSAATLPDAVTPKGFAPVKGSRCVSEMVGVHPVGGPGSRWSAGLWDEAQDWCLAQGNCTGIMLYVGKNTMNCHHWCGRPQFCSGLIDDNSGVEVSEEWNLWARDVARTEL